MVQDIESSETLLERCPFCDYSLEGLPVEHTCPECGRTFDRRWRVFGHLPRWRTLSGPLEHGVWFLILISSVGLVARFAAELSRGGFSGSTLVAVTSLTAATLSLIRYMFGRPQSFIAVGPDHVTVCHRSDEPWTHLQLSEILSAKMALWGNIRLRRASDSAIMRISATRGEAERCAAYINALIDRDG